MQRRGWEREDNERFGEDEKKKELRTCGEEGRLEMVRVGCQSVESLEGKKKSS